MHPLKPDATPPDPRLARTLGRYPAALATLRG